MTALRDLVNRYEVVRSALAWPRAARRTWRNWRNAPAMRLLDRFEETVTGDVQVRLPEFEGEFLIGPRSHLLHRVLTDGEYEPKLAELFLSHLSPDRDVLDIGANIGFYTVLAAKHLAKGRVLAVEPSLAARSRLQRNLALNNVEDKVVVFNGLVSDRSGVAEFHLVPGREEYSSMARLSHPSVKSEYALVETVESVTLDELVRGHNLNPALIKIDVEGAEGKVFAGAQRTLELFKPTVLSEFSPRMLSEMGSSADEILSMFRDLGYQVTDPKFPRWMAGKRSYGDILAVPLRGAGKLPSMAETITQLSDRQNCRSQRRQMHQELAQQSSEDCCH